MSYSNSAQQALKERPAPAAGNETMKFDIQPTPNPTSDKDRTAKLTDPGFGRGLHRPHVDRPLATRPSGWHDARVVNPAPISPLDPAAAVLHYAQEIFEGLKAYKRDDGGVNLFRPDANAKRFQNSADRMALAQVPEQVFIEAVEQLRADRPATGSRAARAVFICGRSWLRARSSSASNRRRNTSSR